MGNKLKTIDKIAQIISLSYCCVNECTVIDLPGLQEIKVRATWEPVQISSIEFSEKQNEMGGVWEQVLTAVVTGLNKVQQEEFEKMAGIPLLMNLGYTNNLSKIVGTKEFPVFIVIQSVASSHAMSITFNRVSPECSKILKSF